MGFTAEVWKLFLSMKFCILAISIIVYTIYILYSIPPCSL